MKKYKMKEYDPIHNIWTLNKRFFFIFWWPVSVGTKQEIEKFINEQEKKEKE